MFSEAVLRRSYFVDFSLFFQFLQAVLTFPDFPFFLAFLDFASVSSLCHFLQAMLDLVGPSNLIYFFFWFLQTFFVLLIQNHFESCNFAFFPFFSIFPRSSFIWSLLMRVLVFQTFLLSAGSSDLLFSRPF